MKKEILILICLIALIVSIAGVSATDDFSQTIIDDADNLVGGSDTLGVSLSDDEVVGSAGNGTFTVLKNKIDDAEDSLSAIYYIPDNADVSDIEAIISETSAGDTISFAENGTYDFGDNINNPIEIAHTLILQGNNATIKGQQGFLFQADEESVAGSQVYNLNFEVFGNPLWNGRALDFEQGGDYIVENCTFRNGNSAIYIRRSSGNVVINNNRFFADEGATNASTITGDFSKYETGAKPINIMGGNGIVISNNLIVGNWLDAFSIASGAANVEIYDNRVEDVYYGVFYGGGITNITLIGNAFVNSKAFAVGFVKAAGNSYVYNNTFMTPENRSAVFVQEGDTTHGIPSNIDSIIIYENFFLGENSVAVEAVSKGGMIIPKGQFTVIDNVYDENVVVFKFTDINTTFETNSFVTDNNVNIEGNITKNQSNLDVSVNDIIYGEDLIFDITTDTSATGFIIVILDGATYTVDIIDGKARLTVKDLAAGNYAATLIYSGDMNFLGTTVNVDFDVLKNDAYTFTDLQELIDDAEEGSTIELNQDYVYDDSVDDGTISINKEITINGNGHTLDGNNQVRIMNVYSNVVLNNIGFINGVTYDDGGAIYAEAYLTIIDCNFENNYADDDGGAICSHSDFSIVNSTFISNSASDDGGVIYAYGVVNIVNSTFVNNSGNYWGNVFAGTVNCINSTFVNNYARYTGGAIHANDNVYVINSTFVSNSAGDGGAIYYRGNIDVINSSFIYNSPNSINSGKTFKSYLTVDLSSNAITVGENLTVDVYTNYGASGDIAVTIDGVEYTLALMDYHAQLNVVGLGIGSHKITSVYSGNDVYKACTVESIVNAIGSEGLYVFANDIPDNENLIIDVYVGGNASGNVSVEINGKTYAIPLADSHAQLAVSDLEIGNYTVMASYMDMTNTTSVSVYEHVGTFSELQEIINNAEDGSIIELNYNYVYDEYVDSGSININKALTINGNGRTLDGSNKVRIMNVGNNVVLNNINFVNGHAYTGGAIYYGGSSSSYSSNSTGSNSANSISILNSTFISNSADDDGGVIYASGRVVNIVNSTFVNNSGNYWGNVFAGTVNCINSTFVNNYAGVSGGAIYANSVNISDSTFISNSADQGGAIRINSESSQITNSTFIANGAGLGGAIYSRYSNIVVSDSSFINNTDNDGNYAVHSHVSNLTIEDCIFIGNNNVSYSKDSFSVYISLNGEFYYPGSVSLYIRTYIDEGIDFGVFINDEFYRNISVSWSNSLVLNNLTPGEYRVSFVFEETERYYGRTSSTSFIVNKFEPEIDIGVENIQLGEDLIVNVALNCNVTDYAIVNVGNNSYNISLVKGKGNLAIPNLDGGSYEIMVIYGGNDLYESVSSSASVVVLSPGDILLSANDIVINEDLIIEITVGGNATDKIYVDINNETYAVDIINSHGTLSISDLPIGEYAVVAYYNEGNSTISTSCNVSVIDYTYTFSDLQTLINDAKAGSTIELVHNYVYDNTGSISINKAITINGNGHILDGNNEARIFDIYESDVVLNDLTFVNGNSWRGGAIYNNAYLTINNCNFVDNYANDDGGAICSDSDFSIVNSTFISNSASDDGGVIYASGRVVNIVNSTFVNNSGNYWGNVFAGTVNCINSIFMDNYARCGGGAIYVDSVNVKNSTFIGNSAQYDGGAIRYGSTINVVNSSFINNTPSHINHEITFKSYLTVDLSSNVIFVGEDVIVDVYTNYGAFGSVTIAIDGVEYSSDLVDFHAQFNVTGLGVGSHTITASYSGNDVYKAKTVESIVNVIGSEGIFVFAEDIEYPNDLIIDVYVGGNASGTVSVVFNGKQYPIVLYEGHAQLTVPNVECGNYTITASYMDMTNSTSVSVTEHIGTFTELQEIINNAIAGDIIELAYNYVYDNDIDSGSININKAVTINGNGHTLDGSNQVRIIYVSANGVVFNNLTFINGNVYDGGAIHTDNEIAVRNCLFINNTADYGAAIHSTRGKVVVDNSTFINNVVDDWGGAIQAYYTTLIVNNSFFYANHADDGGAIHGDETLVLIYNSVFDENDVYYSGGAISTKASGKIIVNSSTFINNAANDGGALYSTNGVTVSNSTFEYNSARYNGGAIYVRDSFVNVTDSVFTNNTAQENGAAIHSLASSVEIENSNFTGNRNVSYEKYSIYFYLSSNSEFVYPDSVSINIVTYDDETFDLKVFINDEFYNNIKVSWSNSLVLNNLTPGEYRVSFVFDENERYYGRTSSTSFIVNKFEPEMDIDVENIQLGEDLIVNVAFNCNVNDYAIVNVGNNYYNMSLVNGKGNLVVSNLDAGTYDVVVIFDGNNLYKPLNSTESVVVLAPEDLIVSADDVEYPNDLIIDVYVGGNGAGIVSVEIDGNAYSIDLVDSHAQLTLPNLEIGNYIITANYENRTNNTSVRVYEHVGTFTELQEIIDNAPSGSVIELNYNYVYNERVDKGSISVNKEITINGNGRTLDGNNQVRIMEVYNENAVLSNIIFINGASNEAGAIFGNYGFNLVNCTFVNNSATGDGGAIHNNWGYFTIVNCSFVNNSAGGEGGAIHNYWANFEVVNSTFVSNSASYGGAVYTVWGVMDVSNSVFAENSVPQVCPEISADSILTVDLSSTLINIGEELIIDINTNYGASGSVKITIDDVEYTIDLVDYHAQFIVDGLEVGSHTITCEYSGNDVYKANIAESTVDVIGYDGLFVFAKNIEYPNDLIIDVYVGGNATGNVNITFNGKEYSVTLARNHARLIVPDLEIGEYMVTVNYENMTNTTIVGVYEHIGTFTELQELINNASSGSVIELDYNYVYNPRVDKGSISVYKDITIDGNGRTLDGNNQVRIMYINANNVTLNNISFSNAYTSDVGGAIYTQRDLTVNNCNFTNNRAYDGGAIYTDDGYLTINNCNFILNSAQLSGGAIFCRNNKIVEINSSFINNHAGWYGGASSSDSVTAINSTYINNYAGRHGGACSSSDSVTAINSTYINNYAGWNGGALNSANLEVINSSFTNNGAGENGGAICSYDAFNVVNCNFEGNHADWDGGAIYAEGTSSNVTNSSFIDNSPNSINGGKTFKSYLTVDLSSNVLNVGENLTVDVYTNYGASGDITLTVDDVEYTVALIDYHAQFNVAGLGVGSHSITSKYSGNDVYKANIVESTVNVIGPEGIFVFAEDIEYPNDLIIDVYVGGNFSGSVSVTIDGKRYKLALEDSHAQLSVPDLGIGSYLIRATYMNITNTTSVRVYEHVGTFSELQELINNAEDGSILELEYDYVYNEIFDEGIVIRKTLTINGNGHTLDGKNKVRIFHTGSYDIVLYNISFINGHSYDGDGGAIDSVTDNWGSPSGSITLINTTFINNSVVGYNYGGGAICANALVTVINSTFIDNAAMNHYHGGAIYADSVYIVNSTFIGNTAYDGGAVYCPKNEVYIDSSKFENNIARGAAGAVRLAYSSGNITNSVFIGNDAGIDGGAINLLESTLAISSSAFINNTDNDGDYAIHSHVSDLSLEDCDFIGNNNVSYGKLSLSLMVYADEWVYDYLAPVSIDILTWESVDVDCDVYINGEYYDTVTVNWYYNLVLNNLTSGEYTVLVVFEETQRYYGRSSSDSFIVNKFEPTIDIDAQFVEDLIVNVTFDCDVNGYAIVNIGNNMYNMSLADGKGNLIVSDLDIGIYDVTVIYGGSESFEPVTSSVSVVVLPAGDILVFADDILNDEDLIVDIYVGGGASGEVNVFIDEEPYAASLIDGYVQLSFSNLEIGKHNLTVTYMNASETIPFTVSEHIYTFTDLQELINQLPYYGGVIDLQHDYIYDSSKDSGPIYVWEKEFTINGNGHILNGNNKVGIFVADTEYDVMLYNITFINGNSEDDGGAINHPYGGLYVIGCTFINNTADYGGAICSEGVIVSDSIFINNTANYGGAIYSSWTYGNKYVCLNSTFINNTAIEGGAIYWGDAFDEFDVTGSSFISNYAKEYGGAIYYCDYINSNITDSIFRDNVASIDGGAIYFCPDAYVTANNTIFENNIPNNGIYDNSTLKISIIVNDIFVGENLKVILYSDFDNVTVNVNNITSTVNLNEGLGTIEIGGLSEGKYRIIAFNGKVYNMAYVTVNRKESTIDVSSNHAYVGDNLVLDMSVTDGATGSFTVIVNNETHTAVIDSGSSSVSIPNLPAGEYDILIMYSGDEYYLPLNLTISGYVYKYNPLVTINAADIVYGEDLTIDVLVPGDSSGNITLFVGDKTYYLPINDGIASVNISNLDADYYYIDVIFYGDEKYSDVEVCSGVYVNRKNTNISVATSNIVFGDDLIVDIILSDNITDTVSLYVGDYYYEVNVINGTGQLKVSEFNAGNYSIDADYYGNNNYDESHTNSNVFIAQKQSYLDVSFNDIVYGEELIFDITTDTLATGDVSVIIGGTDYSARINNGKARLTVEDLLVGDYNATFSYPGDMNFIGSACNVTFSVSKKETSIYVYCEDVDYGEYIIAEIYLSEAIDENVTVIFNNENYTVMLDDGVGQFSISDLAAGKYPMSVSYEGNSNLLDSHTELNATVNKFTSVLEITCDDIIYGENLTADVSLDTRFAIVYRATGDVSFIIDGNNYTVEISNAAAGASFAGLPAGVYRLKVVYSGDENFTQISESVDVTVKKFNTTTSVNSTGIITYGDNLTVDVYAYPVDSTYPFEGSVRVIIGSKTYDVDLTGNHGRLVINDVDAGNHTIIATFKENELYYSSRATSNLTVNKKDSTIAVSTSNVIYGEDVVLNINLDESATGDMLISYGDTNKTIAVTNIARLSGLDAGTYNIVVDYLGDNNFNPSQASCNVTVAKKQAPMTITYDDIVYGDSLNVTVSIDVTGNVTIEIGNRTLNLAVVDGQVKFAVDGLDAGNYSLKVNYFGDNNYFANNTINRVHVDQRETIINVNAANITYQDNYNLTMNINATGKVNVTIDNVTYTVEVVNNYAVVPVPVLNAGTYTVIINYLGNRNYYSNDTITYIYIDKKKTIINVEAENITYGDDINITYNIEATGDVNITMNNVTYVTRIINNHVTLPVGVLNAGNYTVVINYYGDVNYYSNTKKTYIYIDKSQTTINVKADNIVFGDKKNITININATGKVNVTINNVVYYREIINNQVSVPVDMLNAGNYSVIIDYYGDINHYDNSTIYKLYIDKHNTTINVNCDDIIFGDELNLTVNVNATGNVNITIDNVTYTEKVVNNQTTFHIGTLNAGNYTVHIQYLGDTNYYANDTVYSVFVDKRNTVINVNCDDIIFGDRLNITVNVEAVGDVDIEIANVTYHATVENNKASLAIDNINAGNYTARITYLGDRNYYSNVTYHNVFVDKRNTTINVNCDDIVFGQTLNITANIKAEGKVNISLDNVIYQADIINNTVELFVGNITAGNHTIVLNYYESANYYSSNITSSVYVAKKQTDLIISATDIVYGDDLIVNVNVDSRATGTVSVNVGGKDYNITLVDGKGSKSIGDLGAGNYMITAKYGGDLNFLASENTADVVVNRKNTYLNVSAADIIYGDDLVVDVTLSEAINDVVSIIIGGKTYTVDLVSGVGSKNISGLNAGQYNITVNYAGNVNLTASNATANVKVDVFTPSIDVSADAITYGDDLAVNVILGGSSVVEDATGNVTVTIGADTYDVNINNASATITVPDLGAGNYTAFVAYSGDSNFAAVNTNYTVTVNKKATSITLAASDIVYGDDLIVDVTLSEAINGKVSLTVNGKAYTVKLTAGKGKATISNLNAGSYSINAKYAGNANLTASSKKASITVNKKSTSINVTAQDITYGDDLIINVQLSEAIGGEIAINVNGSQFTVTLADGVGNLSVSNLNAGEYLISADYAGNENFLESNATYLVVVNKAKTSIIVSAADIVYGDDLIVNVNVDSRATGSVSINVDGKDYNITLADGKGSKSISNLAADTYTITAKYGGDLNFLASENTTDVVVNRKNTYLNVSSADITYGDDLVVDIVLSEAINDVASITVNGKSYTVDLVSGVGSKAISGLTAGQYNIIVNYAGNVNLTASNATASVKVDVFTPSIDVSADAITYGDDLAVNVILGGSSVVEDATGNVTVTIGADTYDVNINNASATITVSDLGAGNYTAFVAYSGDSNFAAVNTTYAVTVNKKATAITLSASDIVYGDDLIVDVTLSEAINEKVVITVNGKDYTVDLIAGKGKATISDLAAGSYEVNAKYAGNANLTASSKKTSITVNKKSTALNITSQNITYGDDLTVNVQLSEAVNTQISVVIGNSAFAVDLVNGAGSLSVSNLNAGEYLISASYAGNENFTSANATQKVAVNKANASIIVSAQDIEFGDVASIIIIIKGNESGQLTVKLSDKSGLIATKTVSISSSNITVPIGDLYVGKYDVELSYAGDGNYLATSSEDSFEVSPRAAQIIIDAPEVKDGQDAVISVNIANATGNVEIDVNGKKYSVGLVNGEANLTISDLAIGKYDVVVSYAGNDVVLPGNKTASFEVVPYSYSYKDLQALIDSTPVGGTLSLTRDYAYDETTDKNTITVSKAITIIGNGHTVDALGKAGIFTISANDVVLDSFTLTNANALRGSAAFITGDNVAIQSTTFTNNTANTGAAVFSQGVKTRIFNSLFMYNKATIGAGVVLSGDQGSVEYSNFMFNSAINGAGLVIYGNDATIYASTFLLNDAVVGAGAISYGLRTNCTDSIFKNNLAYTDYDLLSAGPDLLGASMDEIISESAEENGFGAGLVIYGDDAIIVNSQFVANDATTGAGLVVAAKNCDISDSLFENNTADIGAGLVISGDDATVSDSEFNNNTARLGAGIMTDAASTTVSNSTFNDNTAQDGAGILSNGDKLSVSGSTFTNNVAANTGAGIVVNSNNANITGSEFNKNDAQEGAGILVNGSNTTVSESSFTDNTAKIGTAILVEEEASLIIEENEVSDKPLTVAYVSSLEINVDSGTVGEDVTINVTVVSASLYPISGTVTIKVNNAEYKVDVENNSAVKVISGLAAGTYGVSAKYSGDVNHTASSAEGNFTVSKISGINVTSEIDGAYGGERANITFNFPGDATGTVTVTVNGKDYNATLSDGSATVTLEELPVGKYDVSAKYSGDDKYESFNYTTGIDVISAIVIDAPELEKFFKGPERFVVNVADHKGNAIAGANVTININGMEYVRVTDDKGVASMAINLNSGEYNVTVSCDDAAVNTTITVKATVSGENVTKMFKNGTQYYATFYDTSGKTLANHTAVEFNINGVFYTRYTNEKGVARMNINLNPGEYIITAKNPENGEMYTNIITVLPTIVENYDLIKYYKNASQYSLRLLDDKGNPVGAGVDVRLNINGVFYTRTSNADGYVKMNINLNPGEYIITAEYNGLMASNTIKVLPTIQSKDLSMKYKDGSKFEAKILDGQGKPYAGQTVRFNVNGVFYDRTTGDDGIARLSINLMAGKYIITSSFNGLNAANTITISS